MIRTLWLAPLGGRGGWREGGREGGEGGGREGGEGGRREGGEGGWREGGEGGVINQDQGLIERGGGGACNSFNGETMCYYIFKPRNSL